MAKRKRRDLRSAGQGFECKDGSIVVDPNDCPENQARLRSASGRGGKLRGAKKGGICPCGRYASNFPDDCGWLCGDFNPNYAKASGKKVKVVRPSGSASAASNKDFMFATGLKKPLEDFLVEVGIITIGVGVWYYIMSPILKKAGAKPLSL